MKDDFSRAERVSKRATERLPPAFDTVRCHWLLTLRPPAEPAAGPSLSAALGALRTVTQDPSLTGSIDSARSQLHLESSWAGYLQATRAALRLELRAVCSGVLVAIEPVFTSDYLKLYEHADAQPVLLENFVHVYGPHFLKAVHYARSKYQRSWNLPDAEEVLTAVWMSCISKLVTVLRSYSIARGSQYSYLFTIAKNAAHDYIRSRVKEREDPAGPEQLDPSPCRYRLHEILEQRELVQKLMAEFQRLCQSGRETKKPGDWEFFQEHFLNEVGKDELCRRYGLTPNAFDKRVQRVRERLLAILDSWLGSGD